LSEDRHYGGRFWKSPIPHPQKIGSIESRGKRFSHKNQISNPLGLGSPEGRYTPIQDQRDWRKQRGVARLSRAFRGIGRF